MNIQREVRKMAEEIVSLHKDEVEYLCKSLNIKTEDVIQAWVIWDTGVNEYDNSVYSSNATRVAMHLHNYIKGNWHDKRQQKVLEFMEEIEPKNIAEIGFGTPQRYVSEYVLKNNIRLTLLDFDDESLSFAKYFLDTKSNSWKEGVTLRKYDMNTKEEIRDYDLYVFQDSIEHAEKPTEYLNKVSSQAKPGSYFIFCIPIEVDKAVPEHNMFWRDTEHTLSWIKESGLSVKKYFEIQMNPELDLFAKFLHPDFKEVLILAQKA